MTDPLEAARDSGLVREGEPLLVMLSGGADSVCLLDVAVSLKAHVHALHVNYGLRGEESEGDERLCRELCERLGVPLHVERARLEGAGNLQAEARDVRYAAAERLAEGDYAAAHTATDQAETVLYRLATSPGRRALLGMEPRRGRLVRPLLRVARTDTHRWCDHHGLEFRQDTSNQDFRFARARIRHEVMPALREVGPHAEETIVETAELLRDEAEVLDAAVDELLAEIGGTGIPLAELRTRPPALARLALRRAAGAPVSRRDADAILALAGRGGTTTLDLPGGLRAVVEYGTVRFARAREEAPPDPVTLHVPGTVTFGEWHLEARLGEIGDVVLSGLGDAVNVRAWRDGDRMRPAGLGGSKSLQDIFTDHKVPRELRRSLPVIEAGGEIAWVAGVAVGERFKQEPGSPAIALTARLHSGAP
jgi:tRNA(Ile)-lysidine synthase